MDLVEEGEHYRKFVKQFLMPILINGVYIGFGKVHEDSNPEAANKELLEVN